MTETLETALYVFRKLVYLLYLEIGGLQPSVHPELARKARLNTAFFQREKERQAAEMYHQTESSPSTSAILAPYEERTGLSLEDVHRAFAEGDWRNKFGGYNFGGPKWTRIAEVALDLRRAIDAQDWPAAEALIFEVKKLKTNQGYLVTQFERTDRRRRRQ
jgi:hypothetical protein